MYIILQDPGLASYFVPIDIRARFGVLVFETDLRASMYEGLRKSDQGSMYLSREPTPSPGLTFATDKVRCCRETDLSSLIWKTPVAWSANLHNTTVYAPWQYGVNYIYRSSHSCLSLGVFCQTDTSCLAAARFSCLGQWVSPCSEEWRICLYSRLLARISLSHSKVHILLLAGFEI